MNNYSTSITNQICTLYSYYEKLDNDEIDNNEYVYPLAIDEKVMHCAASVFWNGFFNDVYNILADGYSDIRFSLKSSNRVKRFSPLSYINLSELKHEFYNCVPPKDLQDHKDDPDIWEYLLEDFYEINPSYLFCSIPIYCIAPSYFCNESNECNRTLAVNIKKFSKFSTLAKSILENYKYNDASSFYGRIGPIFSPIDDTLPLQAKVLLNNFMGALSDILEFNPSDEFSLKEKIFKNLDKFFYYFMVSKILKVKSCEKAFQRLGFALSLMDEQDNIINTFLDDQNIFREYFSFQKLINSFDTGFNYESLLTELPFNIADLTSMLNITLDEQFAETYNYIITSPKSIHNIEVNRFKRLQRLYISDLNLTEWNLLIDNPTLNHIRLMNCFLDPNLYSKDNRYVLDLTNCKHLKAIEIKGVDLTRLKIMYSGIIEKVQLINCNFENFDFIEGNTIINNKIGAHLKLSE